MRGWIIALQIMTLAACSGPATQTQKDPQADTHAYRTYRWITQEDAKYLNLQNPRTMQPVSNWTHVIIRPDVEARVRRALEQDLQKQGYQPVSTGQPDFFITFYAPTKDRQWQSSWSGETLAFQGAPLVLYPDYNMTKAIQFREGMAFIVIYDANTKQPAWTGTIVNALKPGEKPDEQRILALADQLLSEFKSSSARS